MSKIELVITGGPQFRLLRALGDLFRFRSTVVAFAERDVRVKYKQALFGFAWAVLQPLVFMTLFTLILGRYAHVSSEGVPYAPFALSALVPWLFLSNAVLLGSNALIINAPLLRKVFFPREVPVVGVVLGGTIDLALGLLLYMLVGPLLGSDISFTWLVAPLLAIPLVLLATGICLMLGGLNVYYRDVRYVVPFLVQIGLFVSPVAYSLNAVPEKWRNVYCLVNPAAGILDSFRRTLALGELPNPVPLSLSLLGTAVVLWMGYAIFKRLEPAFADVV